MEEFLNNIIPNVMDKLPAFLQAIVDTLVMVGWSGSIAFVIGLFLGIVITVTKPGGILQNKIIYQILDKLINFFRSIPFIILLTWVIPLSRLIMGTAINVEGAIVPLVMGTVPFFSRQVESALAETDKGLIEAALSMGSSPIEIIFRVYLRESVAAIARGTTITAISLVGLTAMAGAVGSGGLGDFAIRYGHDRNMIDVTWVTVIVVFILVSIIQLAGNLVVKKNRH
ncbi:MAG: methionine ABC transporter permease [Ruminiclostridium sp.]